MKVSVVEAKRLLDTERRVTVVDPEWWKPMTSDDADTFIDGR